MKTLYIETSTEISALGLISENLEIIVPLPSGAALSKNLGKAVDDLLKQYNFTPEKIACGIGPGSLTGIRVGQAMAKALAYGFKIPLYEFSSPKIFTPFQEGSFAVLIDARMAGIYFFKATHLNGELSSIQEPKLLTINEVLKEIENIPLLISPNPALIEKKIHRPVMKAVVHLNKKAENYLDLKPVGELG